MFILKIPAARGKEVQVKIHCLIPIDGEKVDFDELPKEKRKAIANSINRSALTKQGYIEEETA